MNPHSIWCSSRVDYGPCDCPHVALKSVTDSGLDIPDFATLDVTVYTKAGEYTVEGVRDDSIQRRENGDLWMESADTSHNCRTYTFYDVIGYSTQNARTS